jgi:tRNA dimethylallyltransferase
MSWNAKSAADDPSRALKAAGPTSRALKAAGPTSRALKAAGPTSAALTGAEIAVVVGPTASGKSELALELAERLDGEIVGADSVQVYRHFDIGSSKPSIADRERVAHHLIDVADPGEPLDAATYAALAERAVSDVRARGKLPIVCGGSFLWVRALLYGLAEAPPADASVRSRHLAWAHAEGRAALHARLAEVDPESAARLAPNDFVRVSRALEVFELSGRPLSAFQAAHGFRRPRYAAHLFAIRFSPDELLRRIERRTRRILDAGFVAEVRHLIELGYRDTRPMASVGYRQVLAFVEGRLAEADVAPAIDRATKVFARRQRTWLRDEAITWLDPASSR